MVSLSCTNPVSAKKPLETGTISFSHAVKAFIVNNPKDGGGYKKGAEEWIRSEVGNNLIAVYCMAEFQTWVNKGGL